MKFLLTYILLFFTASLAGQIDTTDQDSALNVGPTEPVITDSLGNEIYLDQNDDEQADENIELSNIKGIYPLLNMYDYWETDNLNPYRHMQLPAKTRVEIDLLPQDCDFSLPINSYVTSHFGYRWGRPHQGTDLDLNTGDSVFAVFDGVVRLSQWYHGYGNFIVIRHYNGLETCYAHLSRRYMQVGDLVNAGQLLGLGGNTGHSTGSHLHFEMRFMGLPIDPERVIDFKNAEVKHEVLVLKPKFFKPYYH